MKLLKMNKIKAKSRVSIGFYSMAQGAVTDRIVLSLRPETEKYSHHIINNIVKDTPFSQELIIEELANLIFITSSVIPIVKSHAHVIADKLRQNGFTVISDS